MRLDIEPPGRRKARGIGGLGTGWTDVWIITTEYSATQGRVGERNPQVLWLSGPHSKKKEKKKVLKLIILASLVSAEYPGLETLIF